MRKGLMFPAFGFVLVLIIIIFRLTAGFSDRFPLYHSYHREEIARISSPEEGWAITKEGEEWNWEGKNIILPVRREASEALVNLPGELMKHEAGRRENSENWLPDSSLTLVYADKNGETLRFQVYYDNSHSTKDPGGLYILREGSDQRIYYHPLPKGSLLPWENLINGRVFPEELRPEDIVYLRLYTPREGAEARQYRYELEKSG